MGIKQFEIFLCYLDLFNFFIHTKSYLKIVLTKTAQILTIKDFIKFPRRGMDYEFCCYTHLKLKQVVCSLVTVI